MHLTLLPALLTSLLLSAAPPSTAGGVPTILSPVPAEEGIHARVIAAQQNADVMVLQLQGVPGSLLAGQRLPPLWVGHWPAGIRAARLSGTLLRVTADRQPDGSSTSLTLTRGSRKRALFTLLSGIRPADPLGLGLTLKQVTASSVTIQSAGQAAGQRTLRPGEQATLLPSQGKVCVQLHAITPIRADFAERGAPPAITGYRVTLSLLTPDPATNCT